MWQSRKKVLVSVIIPTLNNVSRKQFSLRATLLSLKQSGIAGELIIVDNGSNDETRGCLFQLAKNSSIPCRIFDHPVPGTRAAARNQGARKALGDVLLFIDDDIVFHRQDFSLIENCRTNTFACGAKRFWSKRNWLTKEIMNSLMLCDNESLFKGAYLPEGNNEFTGYRSLHEYSFIGCFGCLRAETFWDVGGFDEKYIGWGYEDTDLMMRLILAGNEFVKMYNNISILHLSHPSSHLFETERLINRKRFENLEKSVKFVFKANHLFGIFENDGRAILQRMRD